MHFNLYTQLKQKYYQTKFSKNYNELLNATSTDVDHAVYWKRNLNTIENQFIKAVEKLISNCHMDSKKEGIMNKARKDFNGLANSTAKAKIGYSTLRM